MVAILIEKDQHSKEILLEMLHSIGFGSVLTASTTDEAVYFFKKEKDQVKLVLFEDNPEEGPDLPLSRMVIQNRDLDLTPLILVTENWRAKRWDQFRGRLSRVDSILSRPFGMNRLKQALNAAHERRAERRNSLLILGNAEANTLVNRIYSGSLTLQNRQFHWKTVTAVASQEALETALALQQSTLGGILVYPSFLNAAFLKWLQTFKRTALGASVPVALLSQKPEETHSMRQLADLFFDENPGPSPVLRLLSRRVLQQWQMKDLLKEARQSLKENQIKLAEKFLKSAFQLDSNRWETHELQGLLCLQKQLHLKAIYHFEKALSTQPCSPFAYLELAKLYRGQEKEKLLQRALSFCPQHPQVQLLTEKAGHEATG